MHEQIFTNLTATFSRGRRMIIRDHAFPQPSRRYPKPKTEPLMKFTITLLALIGLSSSISFAADEKKPAGERGKRDPEQIMKHLDTNSDGKVSLDEWKAGPRAQQDPAKAAERFGKIDSNSDGSITLEELKAGFASRGDKK